MSLVSLTIRVGRKYAIYLPKKVVDELGIKEGDVFLVTVRGEEIVLKRVRRKLQPRRYWGEVTPEEVESIGEEISRRFLNQ